VIETSDSAPLSAEATRDQRREASENSYASAIAQCYVHPYRWRSRGS
jgi:hypothetical protein